MPIARITKGKQKRPRRCDDAKRKLTNDPFGKAGWKFIGTPSSFGISFFLKTFFDH
jgi:hypothetical protein